MPLGLSLGLMRSRGLKAALDLNLTSGFLDSRVTFSRGSNATLVDATGKITYAPANLLTYSEQFDNAIWSKQAGVSVTGVNVGVAPDGTTTADEVTFTATTNDSIYQGLILPANTTYAFSVWVKGLGGQVVQVSAQPNAASPVFTPVTLNGQWQRVTAIATTGATAGTLNAAIDLVSGTTPAVVQLWGAQLEPVTYQTTPSTYVATTASAYYGPRFDYDPVTLAPKGLLIEEARTNLALYSQDWTNAAWSKTNITVTAAATASPDGTTNAQRLQATTTAATNVSTAGITATATSASFSVYVKQGSSATAANSFALRNNTTATNLVLGTLNYSTGVWTYSTGSTGVTVSNSGNGWWRLQISASSGITAGDILIAYTGFLGASATAGDNVYLYGAQLEAGSFATSYIPTVASTVTRSADVATMTGTNFSSWFNATQGTFVSDFDVIGNLSAATKRFVWNGSDAGNQRLALRALAPSVDFPIAAIGTGTGVASLNGNTLTVNTITKVAVAYGANLALSQNGAAAVTDPSTASILVSTLEIGSGIGANQLNGHIRSIAYYNTRLPNAQLQTLTAPSLATTLSLSFTNQTYTVGV